MLQLGDLILTAPSELREQLVSAKTLKGKAGLCRRLRPDHGRLRDPVNAAKLALRSLAISWFQPDSAGDDLALASHF